MTKEFKLSFDNYVYRLDSNNDADTIKFILPKMTPTKKVVVEDGDMKFYVTDEIKLRIYINAIKASTGASGEIQFSGAEDSKIIKAFNNNFNLTGITADSCVIIECATTDGGANWFITSSVPNGAAAITVDDGE